METQNSQTRIVQLTAENVKRLKAVTITPDGNMVVIGGRNGQGKTSVLDSIAMALGGADEIPDMPVRRGEEKARVVVDLGDIIVKRTFTAAGGTQLVIENKDGAKYPSPQTILDNLTGKLTFDPLVFIQLKPDRQAAALRELVGLDFSTLDAQKKAKYDERTLVNRDVDRCKALLDAMPSFSGMPEQEESSADAIKAIEVASDTNRSIQQAADQAATLRNHIGKLRGEEERLAASISSLEQQLKVLKKSLSEKSNDIRASLNELEQQEKALAAVAQINLIPLKQKLVDVEDTNRKIRANLSRKEAASALLAKRQKSEKLTAEIAAIESDKHKKLAETKFPIEGLSFDDSGVLFNGVPLGQSSDAEKLRISVAIASAMNPKLRVMLVRNGSLLDDQSLALLGQLASENKLQVWVERVGSKDKCAIIIENGETPAKQEAA